VSARLVRKPIGVVQGIGSEATQQLFAEVLAAPWRPARIAGVIERGDREAGDCGSAILHDIGGGRTYRVFQDLGAGSSACALDPGGIVDACAAVCRDIAAGCGLVILSKFGKLEAESRSGLLAAFGAAMAAGIPVLTTVSSRNQARWNAFAGPYYELIGPSLDEIEAWFSLAAGAE
jgi:hypothetical protein